MTKSIIMRAAAMLCMIVVLMGCKKQKSNYPYKVEYLPVQVAGSEKWSILDINSGELVVKDAFKEAPSPVVDGMFYVMNEDGTYSYYNIENPTTPVNKEKFGSVTVFSEDGVAVASKRGGSLAVINKNCEVVKELSKNVAQCSMFSRGMAAYQNDMGKWGYINAEGTPVIEAKYETANLFMYEDLAVVIDEKNVNDSTMLFSVIDKEGKEQYNASTSTYAPLQPSYSDGVLVVAKREASKKDTIVLLDQNGKETESPIKADAVKNAGYKDFKRTAGGYYIVLDKNNKMGLVDEENNVLIDIKHDGLTDVREDRYLVRKDSTWSLVDEKGEAVGNVKIAHAHGGSESLYATRGFIDTELAAASMLNMVGPTNCGGATPETTLLDMNQILDPNPAASVGQNSLAMPQGPFIVRFMFDRDLASVINDVPCYNNEARVVAADISLNATNLALDTEEKIVDKVSNALGIKGFVLGDNHMFFNETGQVISIGYSHGIVTLCYYMNADIAKPLPREPRK